MPENQLARLGGFNPKESVACRQSYRWGEKPPKKLDCLGKSVGKVQFKSKFYLIQQDSEKISLRVFIYVYKNIIYILLPAEF